ncbi:MAG: ComF family protein [Verrucomicrobiales bacterium]|nr:ComF family protein [Verrucomicrobiales bacterium]
MRPLLKATADLFYPPSCPSCSGLPGNTTNQVCDRCLTGFTPVTPPFCNTCGEPFPTGVPDDFQCSNCTGMQFAFDFARAAYLNTGRLRQMVLRFKYDSVLRLRHPLAHLAMDALDDPRFQARSDWLVVPVPVHFWRKFRRHFNQADEIARIIAKTHGFDLARPLRRTRYTKPQADLDRATRLKNLSAAFKLASTSCLKKRPVLLIDDVLTTGATANACAKVLKRDAGVPLIAVLTITRG